MKIGIMGGTFDPPHIGHLVIAEQAYTQLRLDKVWFAPVGHPPHKNAQQVSASTHRVAMTGLAIMDNPHFELTTADVVRPTPHYITTLFEQLTVERSADVWHLIIGADSLMELPNWYQPMRLLQLARLAVAHRATAAPDLGSLERELPGITDRLDWIDSPMINLASRDLQRRAREGMPLRYVVPPEVLQYIRSNRLYAESATDPSTA